MSYKRICGVYKITSPTERVYIGQSRNINRRRNQYKNLRNIEKQKRLYASLVKYGWESHKFEIIEECELEQLNTRERYWQDYYDVLSEKGLNCVLTPTDELPAVFTKERREKLSESMKGEGNSMYGKDWRKGRTKEDIERWKKAISEGNKGRKPSEKVLKNLKKGRDKNIKDKQIETKYKKWQKLLFPKLRSMSRCKNNHYLVINTETKKISCTKQISESIGMKKYTFISKMNGRTINDTDYMYLKDYRNNVDIDKKYKEHLNTIKPKKNFYLNTETGVFHDTIMEIHRCYGVNYNSLKLHLRGVCDKKMPFIKI